MATENQGSGTQIPVINVSQMTLETADQLVNAAATYGFIFVELESTDIEYNDVQHMFALVSNTYSRIYIYLLY